jgi:cytochrome c oxidase assembly protein subunit 11
MVEMPVMFYVDPEIVTDKDGQRLTEITLSYVFYAKEKSVKAASLQPLEKKRN